jgi:hypothetical protein
MATMDLADRRLRVYHYGSRKPSTLPQTIIFTAGNLFDSNNFIILL